MNRRLFARLLPFLGTLPLAAKLKPPVPTWREHEDLLKLLGFYERKMTELAGANGRMLDCNLEAAQMLADLSAENAKLRAFVHGGQLGTIRFHPNAFVLKWPRLGE